MRCKQTDCPVPQADSLISLPQAKRESEKDEEREREIKRQKEYDIAQGLSWQGQRYSTVGVKTIESNRTVFSDAIEQKQEKK